MPEFKFKCKICGKSFGRLAQLSGHVTRSKDHPSLAEYYEKYPISEKKLSTYHEEYKKEKIENEDRTYDVSNTGKIMWKRKDKTLKQVADMGMSNVHTLLGINSEECTEDFIKLLPVIFTRTNIHICIMGKNASRLNSILPEGLTTAMVIDANSYNYSLAINILLKQISNKFKEATVVIGDGWTMFSCLQLIQYEFGDFDWENNFITVNTIFDIIDDPLNLNMNPIRLMQSTLNRLKAVKEGDPYIPIIISKIKFLVDLESGLEEDLFSEFSRVHLINQLQTAGLTEKVSQKNKGLCIRNRRYPNANDNYDNSILKKIGPRIRHYIFIPSNLEIDWGKSDRVCNMVVKDNLSKWKYDKYRPSLSKIYETEKDNSKEITKETLISDVILTDSNKIIESRKRILLLVDSNIRNLISATPLIRGLYEKYGELDILTKEKLDPENNIIQNYMIRKIYDLKDIDNKFISLKSYGSNIIRTVGCTIGLDKSIKVIDPINVYNNIVEMNYSIVDPYIKSIPRPFCNFKATKGIPNSLAIAMSVNTPFTTDIKIWNCLNIISSRIGNNKSINVNLLILSNEKSLLVDNECYKLRKNLNIMNNLTPLKAASIISSCNLFITTSDTNLSWIGYGLNVQTILLDIDTELPKSDLIMRFSLNRRDTVNIDNVINNVWRNL
jgi:hypothetical protein